MTSAAFIRIIALTEVRRLFMVRKNTAGNAIRRALTLGLILWGVQQNVQAGKILIGSQNTLYTLDPTNAAVLNTVTLSRGGMLNFALDPGGLLYGLFTGNSGNTLGTIDRTSGVVTTIGQISGAPAVINEISFDSAGNLLGFANSRDIIYIDRGTGAVGASFGCAPSIPPSFTAGANAFATVAYTDSRGGEAFTGVAGTGVGCASGSGSSGASPDHSTLAAITTGLSGGSYYGIFVPNSASGAAPPNTLVSFDYSGPNAATPNLTTLGTVQSTPVGIAFDPGGSFAPEPGSVSLLAAGVGVLAFYCWKQRAANKNG
jgi:hypothetical protein